MRKAKDSLDAIGGALIAAVMFLIAPLIFVAMFLATGERDEEQSLIVSAPIPCDATLEMCALFLDFEEVELFSCLRKAGKVQRRKDEAIIRYRGERIYYSVSNQFMINGRTYTPSTIKVKKSSIRKGFSPM